MPRFILLSLALVTCLSTSFAQDQPIADPAAIVTDGPVRVTVLTPQLLRLEYAADSVFEDRASLTVTNRRLPVPEFTKGMNRTTLIIETAALKLQYKRNTGPFGESNLEIYYKVNGSRELWRPGTDDPENLKGTIRTLDGYGGATDWDGNPIALEDGLLSRSGWALIDESERQLFDGDPDWNWVINRPEGERQDWYFLGYGLDYKTALRDFTQIAGKIPMPPRYAFGYWWSRYWVYSDPELRSLMQQFRQYDIPIDVLVIDMDWHETFGGLINIHDPAMDETGHWLGWTGYTWNRNLFPNPGAFLQWTDDFHLKTALNLHPASGIAPMEEQYEDFAAAYGFDAGSQRYIPYQMAEKKWAKVYFDTVLRPMERQGVDFWWLDWQQYPESKVVPGLSNTWWLNYTFFTDMARNTNRRPLLFHRWGGLGNHRYQIGFSGDYKIDWASLRYQFYFTPTASNVGYGYWSHDIGGHAWSEQASDAQLYLRWLQFGAFSPILRTHSAKLAGIERRFWMYPEHFPLMREAVQLRYALVPYLYQAARQAYDSGISPLRPMYYEHPEADEAYASSHQYYFGDDMLIAPVGDSIADTNHLAPIDVWLPEGRWYDWYRGSLLQGGRSYTRQAALHEVPVFVKAGSIIPQYPKRLHLQQEIDTLILSFTPGADGMLDYYEDDGKSNAYTQGTYAQTRIVSKNSESGSITISIDPTRGSYQGMHETRSWELRLPLSLPASQVTVNGQALPYSQKPQSNSYGYDAHSLETRIYLGPTSRTEQWEVEVQFAMPLSEMQALTQGKKGEFRRIAHAVGQMKVEVARENWWATMPNAALKAEQTPVSISYAPENAAQLLREYDAAYAEMLKALGEHPNARPEIARSWVRYLEREEQ